MVRWTKLCSKNEIFDAIKSNFFMQMIQSQYIFMIIIHDDSKKGKERPIPIRKYLFVCTSLPMNILAMTY